MKLAAVLSFLVHLVMVLILWKPSWFDIFRLYPNEIVIRSSMRVDVLALPELERYIARQAQDFQVLPTAVSESKKERHKKNKPSLKEQPKLTRQEIVRRVRQRVGNILQKGSDVLAPSVSIQESMYDSDPFWSELEGQIKQHWNVPPHLKREDLTVVYNVKLLPSGQVSETSVVTPSQNSTYDMFVKEFVEHRLVLNVDVPLRFQRLLQNQGVNITFSP